MRRVGWYEAPLVIAFHGLVKDSPERGGLSRDAGLAAPRRAAIPGGVGLARLYSDRNTSSLGLATPRHRRQHKESDPWQHNNANSAQPKTQLRLSTRNCNNGEDHNARETETQAQRH